jgi:hypothetical protein
VKIFGACQAAKWLPASTLLKVRLIVYGLLLGPARRRDTSAEVVRYLVRNVNVERADLDSGFETVLLITTSLVRDRFSSDLVR